MNFSTEFVSKLIRFEQQVLPALEGHWMRDSYAVSFLEQNLPLALSNSACGPTALSALLGEKAASYIVSENQKSWTNRTQMESALRLAGAQFEKKSAWWPTRGLCLIQWKGPWLEKSFNGSDLNYTHWISVAHGFVYDANWSGWLPKSVWEDVVIHELLSRNQEADGWQPLTGYEI